MANLYDFTERLKLLLYLNHRKSSVNTRHFDDNFQAVDDFARETDQKFVDQDTARSQLQSDLMEIIRTNKNAFDNHVADQTNPHAVTKLQVGLGSADDTSDLDKPVSTAQAAAIKVVQDDLTSHKGSTSNPHSVTKSQVGLGNVPNVATNDQTPSYTAATTLAALVSGEKLSVAFSKLAKGTTDLISHLANKSNPHGVTKAQIGLGSVDNTADKSKPVSTPQQDAIDAAMAQANAYTLQKIADLINGAPESMDTLKEVADAIAANEDVMAALNAAIGTKASQAELDGHTGNTTLHITATERTNWNGAVNAKHSHANKALLDTYTQTEANLKSAVDNKHSHGNKSVIDKITQAMLDTWDTVSGKAAAVHKHVKADITDFPASLKNPTALTLKLNGTAAATYDGSAVKEVDVTPAGIGAAASDHVHTSVNDSGDGKPTTFAYSKAGLETTSWIAAWSGKELRAISPANLLKVIGAAAASHMHTKAQISDFEHAHDDRYYTESEIDTKVKTINDSIASKGGGDMLKTVYDTNNDGTVDKADSAAKLQTARTIDGVDFNGTSAIAHFGTCSTAAATVAKVVACTGFKLVTGARIIVKFTITNTAANPTLNVNGSGARAIQYRGSAISAGYLAANRTLEFVYDGSAYQLVGDLDTNTVYTHPAYTARGAGLYKITVDATGHISAVTAVAKEDITALGIPSQDTNTTYSVFKAATASAAGGTGLVPAPAAGAQAKYLRADGTWQTPPDTNTVYTHPTTAGNKHIPSGGSSGQILRWSADGTAVWGADNNTTYSVFKAASASAAGGSGLVPAPAAGKQASYLRGDGQWVVPTNTTYAVMTGATASAAGKAGLVPAPAASKQTSFLRGDGSWVVPPNTTYGLATASANGLMSAADKAKMDKLKDESVIRNVTIASSAFVANTDDNAAQYPYCADYTVSGMTATCWANVNLSAASKALGVIEQGNTMAGKLRLYANAVPSTAIVIDNIVWKEVG